MRIIRCRWLRKQDPTLLATDDASIYICPKTLNTKSSNSKVEVTDQGKSKGIWKPATAENIPAGIDDIKFSLRFLIPLRTT